MRAVSELDLRQGGDVWLQGAVVDREPVRSITRTIGDHLSTLSHVSKHQSPISTLD